MITKTLRRARHLKAGRRVLAPGQGAAKKKPQHVHISRRHRRSLGRS